MAESDESLLKAINHYQNGLERYMQRQDETKMLHNLGRLYKLPIKVCHLEKTGVGRTVNSLRKLEGEVGDAAKSLVAKWKEMVVQEEEKKSEEDPSQEESHEVPEHKEESQGASHIITNNEKKKNSDKHSGKSSSERRHQSSKSKSHNESNGHEKKHMEKIKKRTRSSSEDSTDDHDDRKNSDSDDSEDMKKTKIYKHKDKKSNINSKDNHKSSRESKNKLKHSSADDESEHESHTSKKESNHESIDKKKYQHKSGHDKKEENSKSNNKDYDKKHDSSKHEKDRKRNHKDKESKEKKIEKHDKHKKSKHIEKIQKDEHYSDKSSQLQGSSSSKKEKIEKNKISKSVPYTAVMNGIGSESGTSFADALGMCGPPPSKKKKSVSQPERPKDPSPEPDEGEENELSGVLPLPKEPLENLDINISTLLPPITPHYRPLGLPVDGQPKKLLSDDEALSRVMMNKNQRTKVYSGNKVAWGKVPTLFDICVRILQDNIDALEYTGGVPYSILKPILEKATANQLYMMEHHNPYLIDDSDELWKLHCQKEFRNKSKEELESWRDMYMRCIDEREAKLRALTANIKQSQDKSIPVRTTKLAYVDSVAKPPRNIARKQAKNDTNSVRPSAKLATLATKGEAGKVSVPNPGSRAAERSSSGSSHPVKAKKAPLMAKTLSLFKNRFRR